MIPQEAYYAVENTNFKARPHRTQGIYSKYNSMMIKLMTSTIIQDL